MARRKSVSLDLAALLPSWELALRAERKSPQTIKSYGDSVRAFLRWCDEHGHSPALDRELMKGFVADLLDAGAEPATARSRQLGMRRFSAWLAEEGEIDDDPLLGLKAPKLDAKVTESLTEDELRRLIKACAGKEMRDRRDDAIVRLMAETAMRAGEVIGLTVADVDLTRGLVTVRRGKGGKGRVAPLRLADRPSHRPLSACAPYPPARGYPGAVAGRPRQGTCLFRAAQHAAIPRRAGRYRRVPSAPAAAHRRHPVAATQAAARAV